MQIKFKKRVLERYGQEFGKIDSGKIKDIDLNEVPDDKPVVIEKLEKEIRRLGVWYEDAEGSLYCIVSNLKVYRGRYDPRFDDIVIDGCRPYNKEVKKWLGRMERWKLPANAKV